MSHNALAQNSQAYLVGDSILYDLDWGLSNSRNCGQKLHLWEYCKHGPLLWVYRLQWEDCLRAKYYLYGHCYKMCISMYWAEQVTKKEQKVLKFIKKIDFGIQLSYVSYHTKDKLYYKSLVDFQEQTDTLIGRQLLCSFYSMSYY